MPTCIDDTERSCDAASGPPTDDDPLEKSHVRTCAMPLSSGAAGDRPLRATARGSRQHAVSESHQSRLNLRGASTLKAGRRPDADPELQSKAQGIGHCGATARSRQHAA